MLYPTMMRAALGKKVPPHRLGRSIMRKARPPHSSATNHGATSTAQSLAASPLSDARPRTHPGHARSVYSHAALSPLRQQSRYRPGGPDEQESEDDVGAVGVVAGATVVRDGAPGEATIMYDGGAAEEVGEGRRDRDETTRRDRASNGSRLYAQAHDREGECEDYPPSHPQSASVQEPSSAPGARQRLSAAGESNVALTHTRSSKRGPDSNEDGNACDEKEEEDNGGDETYVMTESTSLSRHADAAKGNTHAELDKDDLMSQPATVPRNHSAITATPNITTTTTTTAETAAVNADAYRFLLHHIDAEIAALRRRQRSVSARRQSTEAQLTRRVRELFAFMESPWLLMMANNSSALRSVTSCPPLPATAVDVYIKEQVLKRHRNSTNTNDMPRIDQSSSSADNRTNMDSDRECVEFTSGSDAESRNRHSGGLTSSPTLRASGSQYDSHDKMFILACHKNFRSLPAAHKAPYEDAARCNAAARQEMRRRLATGCARFEAYCESVQECTADMVRQGVVVPPGPTQGSASSSALASASASALGRVMTRARRDRIDGQSRVGRDDDEPVPPNDPNTQSLRRRRTGEDNGYTHRHRVPSAGAMNRTSNSENVGHDRVTKSDRHSEHHDSSDSSSDSKVTASTTPRKLRIASPGVTRGPGRPPRASPPLAPSSPRATQSIKRAAAARAAKIKESSSASRGGNRCSSSHGSSSGGGAHANRSRNAETANRTSPSTSNTHSSDDSSASSRSHAQRKQSARRRSTNKSHPGAPSASIPLPNLNALALRQLRMISTGATSKSRATAVSRAKATTSQAEKKGGGVSQKMAVMPTKHDSNNNNTLRSARVGQMQKIHGMHLGSNNSSKGSRAQMMGKARDGRQVASVSSRLSGGGRAQKMAIARRR